LETPPYGRHQKSNHPASNSNKSGTGPYQKARAKQEAEYPEPEKGNRNN
jgi:hypothetical protein